MSGLGLSPSWQTPPRPPDPHHPLHPVLGGTNAPNETNANQLLAVVLGGNISTPTTPPFQLSIGLISCFITSFKSGSRVLGPGSSALYRSRIQGPDPGPWIQDPSSRIGDPESRIQGPGSSILDPGSWVLDPEFKLFI